MAEIEWTPEAVDDFEEVSLGLSRVSAQAAKVFSESFDVALDQLAQFPDSGREVSEANFRGLRETIVGNYRVLYRHDGGSVRLLAIRHGARRFRVIRGRLSD